MGSVNAQVHNELLGSWTLKIENLQHKVVTTMVIHFIDNEAPSCLSGNWKQVVVDSYESSDSELVPANEAWSYEFENKKLSIGRNEICDAYLQMSGELINSAMAGEYYVFGWGNRKLGYFSLKRSGK
jgi:hypothetical protein